MPVAAEEGFTGLVNSGFSRGGRSDSAVVAEGLEECEKEELLRVDQEGRCVITDHGHFVVFNVYGPRAVADDAERVEFKHRFYDVLEVGVSSASRKKGICCWGSQHCSFCYGSV